MKKLINNPADVVKESLEGMLASHGDILNVSLDPYFISRKDAGKKGKVAVISGGGSGHEPLHGGYVGYGMLDAACPGEVFTSPTPDQMAAAVSSVDGGAGVLFIVKNYSGDVMNFEMAVDMCDGVDIKSVIIDDDVAVKDSLYTTGRRGVGSTIFAEKICGASAERGDKLDKVMQFGEYCKHHGRSMGMALTSCTVPAVGKPTFTLADDEVEMGVGIHGEPGKTRMKMKTVNEFVDIMMDQILDDLPFKAGDDTILILNGMGGSPLIELYIAYARAAALAKSKQINIRRNLVGNYITSLDMQGFSISILKADDEIIKLWDYPVHTAGLRWGM